MPGHRWRRRAAGRLLLDVVAGLPTLRVFGRARGQAAAIRQMTDRYRRATMSTLRVTFLSSLILELLATMSVALVAVAVDLRLLGGHLGFRTALFVLVLAPEAYLPLRLLGTNYHASTEGMEAAAQVFEVLDAPVPDRGTMTNVPDVTRCGLAVSDLVVSYPDGAGPALDGISFAVGPGETVAVVGPSGCGKTTLLLGAAGLRRPGLGAGPGGRGRAGGSRSRRVAPTGRLGAPAPAPVRGDGGRQHLPGHPDASEAALSRAVSAAGLGAVVARLPDGLATELGENGAGLSAGERQRVALARAFVRDAPLLLLDEPTANLDGRTEEEVVEAIGRHAVGRTCVVVAHRPALLGVADRVVDLTIAGARP